MAFQDGPQEPFGDEVIQEQRESGGGALLVESARKRKEVEEADGGDAFGDGLEGQLLQAVGEPLGRRDDRQGRKRVFPADPREGVAKGGLQRRPERPGYELHPPHRTKVQWQCDRI